MSTAEGVVKTALALVRPAPHEEKVLRQKAELIVERTRRAAEPFREVREVTLGGSFAKGTWLQGEADLDVFLKLDPATPEERFEEIGLKVGAGATRGYPRGKKYAQHPYTEADFDGVRVNIVPCYDVKPGEWKSAADRSPFHVELVRKMQEEQKDQVRLLKRFMRGVGTYGAEIETEGFSGYAAEVLVIQHGDLLGVLRSFAEINREGDERLLRLPDPVDQKRDLARAISNEKIARMVLASRGFLASPSTAYFGPMRAKVRAPMRKNVVALVFSHPRLSEDTLWGELKRTLRHLQMHVEEKGFKLARVIAASNNSDRSAFLFIPEFGRLPDLEQRMGPTVDRKAESEAFIRANRRKARMVWLDDDARLRILQEREQTEIGAFLKEIVRSGPRRLGASARVGRGIAMTGKVVSGRPLRRMAASSPWLAEGLVKIASDTIGTGTS